MICPTVFCGLATTAKCLPDWVVTKKVKAEEKRVVGEIKKGYKKGGVAKKQGGGAMFSRGYGVGEPSRRMPTELLDRGPGYKKGGSIKKYAKGGGVATRGFGAVKHD